MNMDLKITSTNVWKGIEGLLYTIAYAPNAGPDKQGDWIGKRELRDCAHTYLDSGEVRLNHQEKLSPKRAKVVESYILESDTLLDRRLCKAGSWIVVFKLFDEDLIEKVKAGILKGVSIAGTAKRHDSGELYACTINEISLVSRPASGIEFMAIKSEDDTPFLERPETIAALRAVAAEIEDLKTIDALQRERDALLSQASARAKAPKRRPRFFDYDEWQAEQEYRNNREFDRNFHEHVRETEKHNRGKQTDYGR